MWQWSDAVSCFIVVYLQFTNFWQGWKFTEILGRADDTCGPCFKNNIPTWMAAFWAISSSQERYYVQQFSEGPLWKVKIYRYFMEVTDWYVATSGLGSVGARNMTGGPLKCEERIFSHHAGLQFMQTYFITVSFLFQFFIPAIINLSLMDSLSKLTCHLSQYVLCLSPNATPSFFSPSHRHSIHIPSLPCTRTQEFVCPSLLDQHSKVTVLYSSLVDLWSYSSFSNLVNIIINFFT